MFIAFLASIEATTAGTACTGLDRQRRRFVARTGQAHCDRIPFAERSHTWRLRGECRLPTRTVNQRCAPEATIGIHGEISRQGEFGEAW
jgi:hypothetical protein